MSGSPGTMEDGKLSAVACGGRVEKMPHPRNVAGRVCPLNPENRRSAAKRYTRAVSLLPSHPAPFILSHEGYRYSGSEKTPRAAWHTLLQRKNHVAGQC
jgi:hypothetical protein